MLNDLIRLTQLLDGKRFVAGDPVDNADAITDILSELDDLKREPGRLQRQIDRLEACEPDDHEALVTALVHLHLRMDEICSTMTDLHEVVKALIVALPQTGD